jgi:hypothetical protein
MDARTRLERSDPDHGPELRPDEARQAVKTGFMRRVLTISTVLAVIALIGVWLWSDRPKPIVAPAASSAAQAPALPQDQERATTPPTRAAPQTSPALP